MEVGTCIIEWAVGELCPIKAELLPSGSKHGMFAFGIGAERREGFCRQEFALCHSLLGGGLIHHTKSNANVGTSGEIGQHYPLGIPILKDKGLGEDSAETGTL